MWFSLDEVNTSVLLYFALYFVLEGVKILH